MTRTHPLVTIETVVLVAMGGPLGANLRYLVGTIVPGLGGTFVANVVGCLCVTVRSRRGEITVKAQVTDAIKEGSIWTTPHFAAASANVLTNDVLDDRAKIPEYKAAAAEIEVDVDPADD
jgi:hypothetical protein